MAKRTNPLDTDAAKPLNNEPLAKAKDNFMKDAENILTEARAEMDKAIAKVASVEQIAKDLVNVLDKLVPIVGAIASSEGSGSAGSIPSLKSAVEAIKGKLACPDGNCG